MFAQLSIFIATAFAIALAPGPDNLGTLSIGLSRGRGSAVAFACGCALGCLTHTCWAAFGVTALLAASPIAFTTLKIVGAAYLAYLGVLSIRHAGTSTQPREDTQPTRDAPARFLLRGFIANAINPKVALFFLAFLPQFVSAAADAPAKPLQIVILGLAFATVTVLVFGTIGCFAGLIGRWLRERPRVGRRLDELTGILFIGLGVRLLLQRRMI